MVYPLVCEALGEMLHSIQSEALQLESLNYPRPPVLDIFADLFMGIIDVCKHYEVSVTLLTHNRVRPALVIANDLVDSLLIVCCIVLYTILGKSTLYNLRDYIKETITHCNGTSDIFVRYVYLYLLFKEPFINGNNPIYRVI